MQFFHLSYSRRQHILQAQRLTTRREEGRAGMQARQRTGSCLMALGQLLQVKVAQVLHIERSGLHGLGVPWTAVIGGAPIGEFGSPEPPTLELRAHMQFESCRGVVLIAPTATPELGQLVGQADAAAVLQDYRLKAPQQPNRHVMGRLDDHATHLL